MSAEAAVKTAPVKARLAEAYVKELRPQLAEELKLKNVHQTPRLEKIVLNAGLGKGQDDKRLIEVASNTLLKITGQAPLKTTAKKSIASFKLREGSVIGVKVTLRGARMYEFADRFINLVLPRLRDFHGVSKKSFDKDGNFTIGLHDQSVFPELSYEDTATTHGLQVIFNIKSAGPEQSKLLLEKLGMPFEKDQNIQKGNA